MGAIEAASVGAAVTTIQNSGLSTEVQMTLLIVLFVLLVAGPVAYWLFSTNKQRVAEGKVADASGGLYEHLSNQVSILTQRLDTVHEAYNKLIIENAEMRIRVSKLETCEEMVERLQVRLTEKDSQLMQRETQLNVLFGDLRMRDNKIIELQERLSVLEVRLARDEKNWKDDLK